jgi:hypothetical protein
MLGHETDEKIVFPVSGMMLQGILSHPAFQFMQLSCIPCLAGCVVYLSSAKLVFIFARFKISASAVSVKDVF